MLEKKDIVSKIRQILIEKGAENPVDFATVEQWSEKEYCDKLNDRLKDFIHAFGLHQTQEEAACTARRIVDFYLREKFVGLNYDNFPEVNLAINEFNYTNPLIAKGILFKTTCEHHLVPINGNALIAYRPQKFIVGLNKLNQVLEFFANRPQLQERLTRQVFLSLTEILQTRDVAVIINARHECISSGGVRDSGQTLYSTIELGGIFDSDAVLKSQVLTFVGQEISQ